MAGTGWDEAENPRESSTLFVVARKEEVELSSVVAGIAGLLARTLPKEVELVTSGRASHTVEGDVTQLGQVVLNLCINASDAMGGRGRLEISIDECELDGDQARSLGVREGRCVTLSVADTGCGMDAATRSRMFEPFFTTKPPGRGTGLGLAMVYGTIAHHHGAIAVDSEVGRGTTITIHLPAIESVSDTAAAPSAAALAAPGPAPAPAADLAAVPAAPSPAPTGARATSHRGAVLVVDDEPLVRGVTRRSLERAGYQVLTAGDGAEGLAMYQQRAADIGVVVLDMAMPVMGGAECFHRLRALDPQARVLLASGYALEEEARACLAAGALGFLEKPFRTARLLEAIALARADRPIDEHLALPG